MSKILIFGDFTTEARGKDAVLNGGAVDHRIIELIKASDYSLVNLEAPIADEKDKPIVKFGPNLRTIKGTVSYFSSIGIKGVTLANNHFYDYGEQGVEKTLEAIEKEGLDFVGGGRTEEEQRKILYISLPDCHLAILNYCEHEFSVQDGIGSNPINPISFYYDIQEAKRSAEVILTIVHGGHEGYQLPSPRMQELYRFMIDCGSSVVINHHQHCYSGYEKYHNGYIYYGLGNFFFDSLTNTDQSWKEGYFVSISIEDKQVADVQIHSYIQCEKEKASVRLMTDTESKQFMVSLEKLNSIISDKDTLNQHFCEYCESKRKNYLVPMLPYSSRYLCALAKRKVLPNFITKSRKMMLLNYVRCEAHRDILEKSLHL